MRPPYPLELVTRLPEFLGRRRVKWTYPLREMERLGIDRPAYFFVMGGVALQPDEGARLVDMTNPYPTVFDGNLASASAARAAGLVDEVGGKWRMTSKGRELAAEFRRECDTFFRSLEPVPAADIRRLADLLGRALSAIEASDVPKDHMPRTARYRGDPSVPMAALDNAVFGLWQARDDCHMASWREAGFDGPTFDVITRVWRNEAADEAALMKILGGQRPEDVRAGLAKLRRDGLVKTDGVAITEQGRDIRQRIEDETDRRFFAPWPDDVGAQAAWMTERLAAINAALAPA